MTISADHTAHQDQASQAPAEDALSEAGKKFGITAEDYMLPARHQIEMVDPDGRLKPEGEQGTEPGREYPCPAMRNCWQPTSSSSSDAASMTRTPRWSGRAAWPCTRPATARRPAR